MTIKKAVLKTFNSGVYTATVQLAGSHTAYLEGTSVARNLPAGEMTAGRNVAVLFFDEQNAGEAVIIAVYG